MTARLSFLALGLALCLSLVPVSASAQDRPVRLFAPAPLVDSGLIKHILPRFTLKTRVRVELVQAAAEADLVLGPEGTALFAGLDRVWSVERMATEHAGSDRFADWLASDVGANTVMSFAPDGKELFGPPPEVEEVAVAVVIDGDAALGHEVSRAKCLRCHAIDPETRGFGIGSTPSFMVLRALRDWEARFAAFYTLNPHPSFTIVKDLTLPFPDNRPPPIAPIEMTIEEVDAILAYVAALAAADLGAPLQTQ